MTTTVHDRLRPLLFSTVCPLCRTHFGHETTLGIHVSNSKKRLLYGRCLGCDTLFFNEVALLKYIEDEMPSIDFVLWTPMELQERMDGLQKRWDGLQKRMARARKLRQETALVGEERLPESAAFVPRTGFRTKENK